MLHDTLIGSSRALNLSASTSTLLPGGMIGLRFGPSRPPCTLVLCGTGDEFLATSDCPTRSTTMCGSNMQHGWSISTLPDALALAGAIGTALLASLASTRYTTTHFRPLFFGLTTTRSE